MIGGFSVFDSHPHLAPARHSGREATAADLLRHMDRTGIDPRLSVPFPGRFTAPMCPHPYQPDDRFRVEVRRGLEAPGPRTLKLQPRFSGLNPMGKPAEWVFGIANGHRLPAVFYTGSGTPFALPVPRIPRIVPFTHWVSMHGGLGRDRRDG